MPFRLTAATLVCLGLAAPLAAQELQSADCTVFGGITQTAVDLRMDGKRPRAATRQIQRGLKGDSARFKDAVPLLVEFVYGLPEGQLGDGVGKTYADACLAQAKS